MAQTRYSDLRDTFHVSRITAFLGKQTFSAACEMTVIDSIIVDYQCR